MRDDLSLGSLSVKAPVASRQARCDRHAVCPLTGEEISAEVLDGPQSVIIDQAENRLHMQKPSYEPIRQEEPNETMSRVIKKWCWPIQAVSIPP